MFAFSSNLKVTDPSLFSSICQTVLEQRYNRVNSTSWQRSTAVGFVGYHRGSWVHSRPSLQFKRVTARVQMWTCPWSGVLVCLHTLIKQEKSSKWPATRSDIKNVSQFRSWTLSPVTVVSLAFNFDLLCAIDAPVLGCQLFIPPPTILFSPIWTLSTCHWLNCSTAFFKHVEFFSV